MEDERYGEAETLYSNSHDNFVRAQDASENAQNEGARLPYLAPFVDEVRCNLLAYLDSTSGLSESMGYIDAGKEERGTAIARETFAQANHVEAQCK